MDEILYPEYGVIQDSRDLVGSRRDEQDRHRGHNGGDGEFDEADDDCDRHKRKSECRMGSIATNGAFSHRAPASFRRGGILGVCSDFPQKNSRCYRGSPRRRGSRIFWTGCRSTMRSTAIRACRRGRCSGRRKRSASKGRCLRRRRCGSMARSRSFSISRPIAIRMTTSSPCTGGTAIGAP